MRTKSNNRNLNIELARFVGAIGILWFHAQAPGDFIGYAALQTFTALTIYFSLVSGEKLKLGEFIFNRFNRIVLPWIAWSIVYAFGLIIIKAIEGKALNFFEPWMLLTGPAIHLWFLPYAFCCSILMKVFNDIVNLKSGNNTILIMAILTVGALASLIAFNISKFSIPTPYIQWLAVLPSTITGLALYFVRNNRKLLALLFYVQVPICFIALLFGSGLILQYYVGIAVIALCFLLPDIKFSQSGTLSNLALGIYLIHPAVIWVISKSLGEFSSNLIIAVVATLFSTAIIYFLKRISFLKGLV
ncbi:acyltransferase family protein [Sneathiella sp. P13V-1]|uniref:acyltransferase family protein n=1 Tax=Sneathiella sp. P13V-1 TaxID=2697366 RepID=UPI00187B48B1|nr:acyltransferase family protein [Sneathiella sp. P13V-1]MBE7636413.1 acyltransferase family protein [Sneathiella sp. P13V-1]